jgi:nucleoside phosphorylase
VSLKEIWRRLARQRAHDSNPTAPSCDVLLLVAIEAEMEALRTVCTELGITMQSKQWDPLGDYFDLGVVGSDRVFAAQRHGDVLVARSLFPYDDRIIRGVNGQPVVDYSRTKRRVAKTALVKLFEREIDRGGHAFGTHVGTLLSGSARIFCGRFRDDLVRVIPLGRDRIIGGDMEGVGLLSVSPADKPLWAVVKGISDFADEERDGIIETTRALACENAVRFVLQALRNNLR